MTMVPPGNQICTGDTLSSQLVTYQFKAPNELWIQRAIYGLMSLYGDGAVWYPCGAVSVDDTVEAFIQMWGTLTVIQQAGIIIAYAGIATPSNTLPCDGASYLRTDYPQLFAAIGVVWGSADSAHFNVPDLRGRTLIDSGTGSGLSPRTIADNGGEETHVLSVMELAAHNHTDTGHAHSIPSFLITGTAVPPPLDGGTELPLSLTNTGTASANIQNSGADSPHNNMQPWVAINYAITIQ